jgi:hypothetical protein
MSTLEKCVNTIGLSVLLLISCGIGLADEVTDWNHIMLEATLTPPATPAPVSTRSTAIVQAAVFDAVNGIDPRYTLFMSRAQVLKTRRNVPLQYKRPTLF